MSSFTKPLVGTWDDDMVNFTLTEEFEFYLSDLNYKVPAGFVTNFASIPSSLKWALSPIGRYGKACVLHDFLYTFPSPASRKKADGIFLEAMNVSKVNRMEANLLYIAVRLFGAKHYNTK